MEKVKTGQKLMIGIELLFYRKQISSLNWMFKRYNLNLVAEKN